MCEKLYAMKPLSNIAAVVLSGLIFSMGLSAISFQTTAEESDDDDDDSIKVRGDFDGDGEDDLAIGVPGEDVGSILDAGAVNVLYGSSNGLTSSGSQFWHQDKSGIEDTAEQDDAFGAALASETNSKRQQ
jgi:FG-GAP repeat